MKNLKNFRKFLESKNQLIPYCCPFKKTMEYGISPEYQKIMDEYDRKYIYL